MGGFALAIAALSMGQTSSPYRAVITNGGQVKLLHEGQQIYTLRYGLRYDGWTNELRDFSEEGIQPDGTYLSKAPLHPGQMSISTGVFINGNTIQLTIRATPSRNVFANSSHVCIRYNDMYWADSTFNGGTWNAVFPRRLDQILDAYGNQASSFVTTSPQGLGLTAGLSGNYPYTFIDCRVYNCGFELRAQETSGAWAAGVTKTYVVNLTPSVPMTIGPDQPITIFQNADWVPLDHKLSIDAGSALDWSRTNPPVAGSGGWIKANASGNFYIENQPSVPVKFFGTNVSGSGVFMDPDVTDALLTQLSRMGYNAIRLVNFDAMLTDSTVANSLTFDPFLLGRLHYFIEAARQKGFYIALDLLSARFPRDNEVLPGRVWLPEYKMLLLGNTTARQHQLSFALNLLNSVSPYTGRKIKDEPAVAWIDLVNELAPICYPRGSLRSEVFDALEAASGQPWGVTTDLDARICNQLQGQYHEWMKTQLRNNGVKSLFTSMNIEERNAFSVARSQMDYMSSNSHYFAHPEWIGAAWGPPWYQLPLPPIMYAQRWGMLAGARIHNKPYLTEEMDAVTPQPYRGEFGLVMGALAAVQKWNAIFRFGYTDRQTYLTQLNPSQIFVTVTDPPTLAAERAIKALFQRGDLNVTDATTVIKVPPATAGLGNNSDIPLVKNGAFLKPLALSNTTGVTSAATPILDGISRRPDDSVVVDYFKQSMTVYTPNTSGIISNPSPEPIVAGRLIATIQRARASIWVTSLDGLPVGSSRRMLLTHLTEIQNTGTTWANLERSIVTSLGTLPHLARDGTALIKLSIPNGFTAKVFRLDEAGRRLAQVPITTNRTNGMVSFTATTRSPFDGLATIYYEIVI